MDQGDAPDVEETPVCCGKHLPPNEGKPIALACQLCRNSPTYYRRDELEGAGAGSTL
ncbi:hypothetical protein [Micromonospora sp. CB01531]|uniref:hypothetical protein n=1 Tax=Micromonospora sp. CB01531 TaxID=1718947 RepID=UPI000A9EC218|nr:hypothetical protein [Micromonospora sp. CB01531]